MARAYGNRRSPDRTLSALGGRVPGRAGVGRTVRGTARVALLGGLLRRTLLGGLGHLVLDLLGHGDRQHLVGRRGLFSAHHDDAGEHPLGLGHHLGLGGAFAPDDTAQHPTGAVHTDETHALTELFAFLVGAALDGHQGTQFGPEGTIVVLDPSPLLSDLLAQLLTHLVPQTGGFGRSEGLDLQRGPTTHQGDSDDALLALLVLGDVDLDVGTLIHGYLHAAQIHTLGLGSVLGRVPGPGRTMAVVPLDRLLPGPLGRDLVLEGDGSGRPFLLRL